MCSSLLDKCFFVLEGNCRPWRERERERFLALCPSTMSKMMQKDGGSFTATTKFGEKEAAILIHDETDSNQSWIVQCAELDECIDKHLYGNEICDVFMIAEEKSENDESSDESLYEEIRNEIREQFSPAAILTEEQQSAIDESRDNHLHREKVGPAAFLTE